MGWLISNEELTVTRKRSERELRAIAYQLVDEIETRAAPLIAGGERRIDAIAQVILAMGGKVTDERKQA